MRLFNGVVNWGVWAPAARWMRQLSFPAKMGVIALAFVLPWAWLMGSLVWNQLEQVRATAQERDGVRYIGALLPVLEAAADWQRQAQAAALEEAGAQAQGAKQAFEQAWRALQAMHGEVGAAFGVGPAFEVVQQRMAAVPQPLPGQADVVFARITELNQALTGLLRRVADGSGLSLDPEMASYHLISAVVLRAPQVMAATGELRGLVLSATAAGELGAAQRGRIERALAVLEHERALAQQDREKARAASPELAQRMVQSGSDATAEFVAAVGKWLEGGAGRIAEERQAFAQLANRTLKAQFEQAAAHLKLLDGQLAAREAALWRRLALEASINLLGMALGFYLAMGFYSGTLRGYGRLRQDLLAMSLGDMRQDIAIEGRDELAGLQRELSYMQVALRDTMRQVRHSSNEVVHASIEIAVVTRDLAARTEAAAAALEESSAALEETTSTTGHTLDAVTKAADLAKANAASAQRGGEVVEDVVQTMARIEASSQKISEIIGVIDSIAFQTNILALNAAVEAARAGEQGRGFAVVAGEVRSLAQRSAQAAKEIKGLITSSVEQVAHGTQVVHGAGEAMREIVATAEQVRVLMDQVSTAAKEQNAGVAQISAAVQQLDQSTQANAALVEQAAAAAKAQRDAALKMAAMVDEFRLVPDKSQQASRVEGVDVDAIIEAHRQWKVKLRTAIEERATVDVATLSRDDCCALGKWIYGEGGQRFGQRPRFTELVTRHKVFHQVAGQVGELVNQRQYLQAEEAMAPGTPFATATREVVQVLSAAKRLGFED